MPPTPRDTPRGWPWNGTRGILPSGTEFSDPPANANGGQLDTHWNRAFDQVVEFEQRYKLFEKPGAVRPLAYINYSDMGDYRNAIDASPVDPNVTTTRSYDHPKYGYGLNLEQSITDDLGVFGRAGWNNGQSESWAFTEVDRTLTLGLSLKGIHWHRPDDVIGVGGLDERAVTRSSELFGRRWAGLRTR